MKRLSIKERIKLLPITDEKKKELYEDLYSYGFTGNDEDRHKLIDDLLS